MAGPSNRIYEYLNQDQPAGPDEPQPGVKEVAERQENGDTWASVSLGRLKAESAGAWIPGRPGNPAVSWAFVPNPNLPRLFGGDAGRSRVAGEDVCPPDAGWCVWQSLGHARTHLAGRRNNWSTRRVPTWRRWWVRIRKRSWISGRPEPDNLAIQGRHTSTRSRAGTIITLKTEHKAVLDTCRQLEREGFEVTHLDVQPNGLLDLAVFEAAIRQDTILAILVMQRTTRLA